MESFGLFDLFKSLFTPADAENADTAPKEEPTAPQRPDDEPPSAPSNAFPNPSSPNAFLDFIHSHDERAKRTKKK